MKTIKLFLFGEVIDASKDLQEISKEANDALRPFHWVCPEADVQESLHQILHQTITPVSLTDEASDRDTQLISFILSAGCPYW